MKLLKTTLVLAAIAGPLAAQTDASSDGYRQDLARTIVSFGFACARIEGNPTTTEVANVYTVMCKTDANADAWYQINMEPFEIQPVQPAQ